MAKKGGLGKGLDTLIPRDAVEKVEKPEATDTTAEKKGMYVDINKVEPNRKQPRTHFNEERLLELADSIKKHDLIEPIIVQDRETFYEIISGERRWRAAKLAGLKQVPILIKNLSEREILEISLIENLQREDLNAIEEAKAYKRLMEEFNLKQDEVAERVSKSRASVSNAIRLLKLCDNVQQMIVEGEISEGHGRAIIAIDDPNEQYSLALRAYNEKMSVRDIEKYIKDKNKPPKYKEKQTPNESLLAIYQKKEEEMKEAIGTKVSVISKDDKGSGKIEIEFYSHDDFERITELIKGSRYE